MIALPRYPYEPESAWCCLTCGPSKPGFDCALPDPHGEYGLIAEIEAEAAPVRECPLCGPYVVACAHLDFQVVRLIGPTDRCPCVNWSSEPFYVVWGNCHPLACCNAHQHRHLGLSGRESLFTAEAAARDEFARRCEAMVALAASDGDAHTRRE